MNKYIKQLTESLFDDIDDIFSDDDEDMEILNSLEDVYLPYVDLCLPSGTLWYKCNLGAKKETDPGLYFQWGDIQGYKDGSSKKFNWETYKYCKGTYNSITKYCNDKRHGKVDDKLELELSDDAAYKMTNGLVCIPTPILFQELQNECTWTWTIINNIKGYKVLSKNNGNYIFFPAVGFCREHNINYFGSYGYYLSRTVDWTDCSRACSLYINSSFVNYLSHTLRNCGFSIRPVIK